MPCAERGCLCHSFINTHFLEQSFSYTHECLKFAFVYIWRFPPIFHQSASIFSWVHPMTLCTLFRTNFLSGAAEETSRKSLCSKMLETLWLLKAHAPLDRGNIIYHLLIRKVKSTQWIKLWEQATKTVKHGKKSLKLRVCKWSNTTCHALLLSPTLKGQHWKGAMDS